MTQPRYAKSFMTCCLAVAGAVHAQGAPIIQVGNGELIGIAQGGVHQYRGIPYAQPPVGALRWVSPQPITGWSGQRDATTFGAACPQVPAPFADTSGNSEDCLTLNVYVPSEAVSAPLPVLVWIHGSGTVLGSGRQYDASQLAQALQAVVVTMNYRLGALGWLWTSGMQSEGKGQNFALQDQQAALRWVQQHIASFNGDPRRVTLSGESIGATSVSLHLVSPAATGLFQRAIMVSGVEPPGLPTAAKAIEHGDAFAKRLNCPAGPAQMSCLRSKPVSEILKVSPTYADIGKEGIFWRSFVDGRVVAGDVLTLVGKGKFNQVPVMLGATRDEGRGFTTLSFHLDGTPMTQAEYVDATAKWISPSAQPLLTGLLYRGASLGGPALAFSQVVTDTFACLNSELSRKSASLVPVYLYEFADRSVAEFVPDPFMDSGAYHGSDIPFLFRTPLGDTSLAFPMTSTQERLSDQMRRYWKRFVETGNPNASSSVVDPVWPRFSAWTRPVMTWVPEGSHLQEWGAFQRAHQCSTWSLLYSLQPLLPE